MIKNLKHQLICGNCLVILPTLEDAACVFADPPDNIGLKYDSYSDTLTNDEYRDFFESLVFGCLKMSPIAWLSFNARWLPMVGAIADKMQAGRGLGWKRIEVKTCVQVFTFGQHNHRDLGNNHRPLWRFRRDNAPLYPDQIRVPSWRQRHGDKRADPRGRVPGDVFVEVGSGDVFDFPRVTGNSKQRCDWHPTQLHEDLIERCLLLSTKPGDKVIDPCAGTGATLRVCERIGRVCTLIEIDGNYCKKIRAENPCLKSAVVDG